MSVWPFESERNRERSLQHLIVLCLTARRVYDLCEIEAQVDVLAVRHAHADANAAAGLSEGLAGLDAVAAGCARIVKRKPTHLDIFPAEFRAQLGSVDLKASRISFVVGDLANVEAAHGVGTAKAELLAGHERIVGELSVDDTTELPIER